MLSSLLLGALASLLIAVEAVPSHVQDAERALVRCDSAIAVCLATDRHRQPGFFSGRFPDSFKNGSPTSIPGIERFVVQYASAQRWKAPVVPQDLKTM